ncbi:TPA: 50S ribosomal protein L25 [Candidatus Acetothermia bacterium]|nr:50S ribosomal protein L25 [Candidatus Acetothermia bacterium]
MTTLKARSRTSGKANALRREGLVPAVIYGPTVDSTPIVIDRKNLRSLFAKITRSSRIDLSVKDGKKAKKLDVFIKAIQYDPITDEPIHVDFYHPDSGHPLKLHVPIKIVGESPGVKEGGVSNVLFRTVRVHGLPKDIPALITIDISNLEQGEAIRVRDLDFGEVEPLLAPERTLVTIVAPRRAEEVPVAAEEELEAVEEEAAAEEGPVGEETTAEETGAKSSKED